MAARPHLAARPRIDNKALAARLAAMGELPGMDLAIENHASRRRRDMAGFMERAYAPDMTRRPRPVAALGARLATIGRRTAESKVLSDVFGTISVVVMHKSCIAKAYHYAFAHPTTH